MFSKSTRLAPLAAVLFLLAACDSSEERAQKHFESGVELLEAGDSQRAILEFRNALALDASHRDARLYLARQTRANGNIARSYSNYLRLAERFPDDAEARLNLAEMAILNLDWDEAERHGTALIEANAEIEGRDVIELALAFREAVVAEDQPKTLAIARQAEELIATRPNDPILHRILIEGYQIEGRFEDAIRVTDLALEADPENRLFYEIKASILVQLGDITNLEDHLGATVQRFPDDQRALLRLLRLMVARDGIDDAENLLRDRIQTADNKVEAHLTLISFMRETRSTEVALTETEAAIGQYENNKLLVALKSGILFDEGQRDEAISIMEGVIDDTVQSDENNRLKVALARMLDLSGNEVGARQLVEQVRENDPNQVEALKMAANWLIDADSVGQAITTLRQALDQEPEDADTMTLLARAYTRNGDTQLAQDMLALAAEASSYAPEESLRLANLLVSQERYTSAEDILVNALRNQPRNLEMLLLLGRVYVANEDWSRAEQVEQTLRRLDNQTARLAADELQLQRVSRRDGAESGVELLEQIAEESTDLRPRLALIRARIREGKFDEALELAEDQVERTPSSLDARMALAGTHFVMQNFAAAEETFREILAMQDSPAAALQLLRVVGAQGREDEVPGLIDELLEQMPDSPDLLWAKASSLENAQDIEGAIGIYERLYEQDSSSPVIANNLASLLSTYRDDEASLERASVVARRLRDTDFAPFQDTFGWILYREGKAEEAVPYLESAARQLSTDPLVAYHLGKAYAATGQLEGALNMLNRALELAGPDDTRAQFADARAEIERLSTEIQQSE
ncbi:MAG: tetratricopeptide repeat protein [Pseudomonadota bacterium]